MTPQERQLVDDLFDRLSKMESAPRDPDATAAIAQGLRIAPNALYPLVQTVLVQDEALKRANQPHPGIGATKARLSKAKAAASSIPCAAPSSGKVSRRVLFRMYGLRKLGSRPVWNSGQVLQQAGQHYDQGGYGQPYGGPQAPTGGGTMGGGMMGGGMVGGGGGSFLGTAAAAAAGVVGGSLLLNSFRGMMGGSRQASAIPRAHRRSEPVERPVRAAISRAMPASTISASNDLAAQDRAQDLARIAMTTIRVPRRPGRHGYATSMTISAATRQRFRLIPFDQRSKNGRPSERPFHFVERLIDQMTTTLVPTLTRP